VAATVAVCGVHLMALGPLVVFLIVGFIGYYLAFIKKIAG
jgi:hypothetical protein